MAVSDRGTRDQMAFMSNLFLGQQTTNILHNVQTLIVVVLGFVSVSVEIFVRREFGSRYLNILRIVAAWQVMQIFSFFLNLPELVNLRLVYGPVKTLHPWFMYSFLTLALVHLLRNWQRERSGIVYHSQSFGISWLSWLPVNDFVLYRFVEPACILAAGWLLRSVDGPTGSWLMIAGVALFVRNNITYGVLRDRYLDVIDARIESKYVNEAQSGKPKLQTAGWQVVPIPVGDLFNDGKPLDIRATVQETMGTVGGVTTAKEG